MKYSSFFPPSDILDKVQDVESGLRQRKRIGKYSFFAGLLAAAFQIAIAIIDSDWWNNIKSLDLDSIPWQQFIPLVLGVILFLFTGWYKYWIKESKKPFRYTCSIGDFTFIENDNDPKEEKIKWLQHDLAKEQQSGFGSMMAFELKGSYEQTKQFVNNLKLATRAVSLGGVETLISHPASTTHAVVPEEDRLSGGVTSGLMRLSVGLEEPEDIIADFEQAFRLLNHK